MIHLQNIVKTYGQHTVVNQLSLEVKKGEFLTFLGPSGCGKTTTLRMIAGFEFPTSGQILLDGEPILNTPPYQRSVNTVFQSYALFPHLNAYDNVAFGLKVKGVRKAEIHEKVMQALKTVQLEDFAKRKPDQLSGGQKQRIAIARALVNNPKVLLLDEPLGALDQKLRKQMQVELKHLQKRLGITFILVTHDQEEALTMSDRIAVMNKGVIEQVGTPSEIYEQPATPFVAEFIGEMNMIRGTVSAANGRQITVDCQGMQGRGQCRQDVAPGEEVILAVRPERVKLSLQPSADGESIYFPAEYVERIYAGGAAKTVAALPGGVSFTALESTDSQLSLKPGDKLYVNWKPDHAVVLKR